MWLRDVNVVCSIAGTDNMRSSTFGCQRVVAMLINFTCLTLVFVNAVCSLTILQTSLSVPSGAAVPLPAALSLEADQVQVFVGNTTLSDHFHQIHVDAGSLLLTARNVVYNVSLDTFTEVSRLSWFSSDDDVQMCLLKQKTKEECHNFIRIIARRTDDSFLVCGTNAYRPLCRVYEYNDAASKFLVTEVESGVARCPYNPTHNSTAVYVGNKLYSATVADQSLRDAIIYSKPLRTEQHDSQWLNEPNFVNSFHHDGRVYFFFRETAVENINCGKVVFSRVARVCTNDEGGARVLRNTWTSFFKARLNCSIPGEFPFYFDEIQSTSDLGAGNVSPALTAKDRDTMIYAVFSTPRNSLRGSAICAFKMDDIVAGFEGPHKEQKSSHSNWLPVRDSDIPDPHPAKTCTNNSLTLSDQNLNFIKSHPLMDKAVPSFGGQPLIVQSSLEYSFTQVAVDWQVLTAGRLYYDVLFVGTDNGRVLKMVNKGHSLPRPELTVIEVITVFSSGAPVTGLRVYRKSTDSSGKKLSRLIVMSRDEVRSVPLSRCHLKTSCSECVALRDPYCSWLDNKCTDTYSSSGIQSIEAGRHSRCPPASNNIRVGKNQVSVPTVQAAPSTSTTVNTCPPCLCGETVDNRVTAYFQNSDNGKLPNVLDDMETYSEFDSPRIAQNVDADISSDAFRDEGARVLRHDQAPVMAPCYKESLDGSSAGIAPSGLYPSGAVAGIAIFCVIAALVIGFFAGYYVNSRLYLRCLRQNNDRLWSLALSGGGKNSSGCGIVNGGVPKRVNQNVYEIDPVKYRIPSCNKFDVNSINPTNTRYIDDDDAAFEPILQRSVGLKAGSNDFVDEIKMSNVQRAMAQHIDDELSSPRPRPPPRRNRSIRKEPDG